ncbi:EGF-like domain-containing protein 2 [Haliotis rufescens]|uniref:EGF-like domain-containing protein 2 n=1 Tax=Haliotis rufescens TaxID=6454 RepID=UPI00201EEB17|nr:EGF-like domain-containing protein 2 [Haliotis rufescens]
MLLMSSQYKMLLTVTIIVTLSAIATASFDCRRKGQDCKNSGTCNNTGSCICATGYEGYNCRIETAGRAGSNCTSECHHGGVCANNTCICTENYYGSTCSNNREQILCFGDKKAIHINPEGFQGTIYIAGNRNMVNCTFKNVTDVIPTLPQNVTWDEGYAILILDNSSECGSITTRTNDTEVIYERFVNIEYDELIVTTLDERLSAKCAFENSTVRTLYGDVVSAGVTAAQYTNTSITNIYEPVVFKVTNKNQPLSTAPMLIGEELTFSFNIPAETGYASVIVMSLTANDTLDRGKTFPIIDNKCPVKEAASVLTTLERSTDNRTVTVKVKVFKFVGNDKVGFSCTARICKEGDTQCDESTCSGQTTLTGIGRRKREAANEKTIETVVKVTEDPKEAAATGTAPTVNPSEGCKDDSTPETDDSECLMKKEIIVVLAIMAATVVILMIACIVLTCKLLKSGTKVVDVPHSEYQPSVSLPRLTPANF